MIISVEMVVVEVDCPVGGGGVVAPGPWIVPANAETARVKVRVTIAPVRRNLFTVGAS